MSSGPIASRCNASMIGRRPEEIRTVPSHEGWTQRISAQSNGVAWPVFDSAQRKKCSSTVFSGYSCRMIRNGIGTSIRMLSSSNNSRCKHSSKRLPWLPFPAWKFPQAGQMDACSALGDQVAAFMKQSSLQQLRRLFVIRPCLAALNGKVLQIGFIVHPWQDGVRAVQHSAPKSMIAWLKSYPFPGGINASANFHNLDLLRLRIAPADEDPMKDPNDISIKNRCIFIEGKRPDGSGRVPADSFERQQFS